MKFSKILTTAMMSAALVASSSALASETTWWTMNFDGLTVAEDSSLTNTLNDAYGTSQNGWWTTEEGDQSTIEDGQIKLNTQGTDLTWTPNGDNDTTAITYIDADVTFVGSDAAPTVTETDIHTAVYLKNLVDDTTSEVTNSVLCAFGRTRTQSTPAWQELTGVTIEEGKTYSLRIMLDGIDLTFFIDDVELTSAEPIFSAKDGFSGDVSSVSFRGTGYVDNFAASQEVKQSAGTASVSITAYFNDADIDTDAYTWEEVDQTVTSINLDSADQQIASVTTALFDNAAEDFVEGSALSYVGITINDGAETLIEYNEETGWPTDSMLSLTVVEDILYSVRIKSEGISNGDNVEVVFYYGTHTASEPEPDPEPVKLATPVVSSSVTDTTVTLTWVAVENASSYDVTFNGTTTNVTDATSFTASDLKAETTYTFAVVANGDDENYVDSDAATVEVTTAAAAEPEPEFAPVAVTGITVDGDTVSLAIAGEYTEVQVYFSETVDGTFTVIGSTFADGVATVTSTTATGFFKVEAK